MANNFAYTEGTIAAVLTFLDDNNIGPNRIVNIYYNGTNHTAVYTLNAA